MNSELEVNGGAESERRAPDAAAGVEMDAPVSAQFAEEVSPCLGRVEQHVNSYLLANDAVGYKAGTSQAFRPLNCSTLLELPLSIMDTAMFYADRMEMTRTAALQVCRRVIGEARRFGGTRRPGSHRDIRASPVGSSPRTA